MATDAQTLARLIHSAVAESDEHAGHLSPQLVGSRLRSQFPDLSDDEYWKAVARAADYRGRVLP